MILLLGIVFFGLGLSFLYGWVMEFGAVKLLSLNEDHDLHFSITLFLGLALLAGLLGIWSFARGVGFRAVLMFLFLGLLLTAGIRHYVTIRLGRLARQSRSMPVLSWLMFGVVLVVALMMAVAGTPNYDTGLYHAQAIHWIESARVVPGLANLHLRLGLNSNVFLLAAFWGFSGFGWHTYQVPDLLIFLGSITYSLYLAGKLREGLTFSGLAAVGFLICLPLLDFIWVLSSPTTNFPAFLISWLVFLLAMERFEAGRSEQIDLQVIAILVLSLLDVTIKLSAMPLLLIPAYLLWKVRASLSIRRGLALTLLSSLVCLPWVARNVVETGYLVFPFAGLDVLRVDWKVPPGMVRQLEAVITSWARIPNQDPGWVMSQPLTRWVPVWFRALTPRDFWIVIGVVSGLCLLSLLLIFHAQSREAVRTYAPVYVVSLLGIIFWFVQAPSPHFGYGFLITLLLILYIPFFILIFERLKSPGPWILRFACVILAGFFLVLAVRLPQKIWKRFIFSVKPYPQVSTTTSHLGSETIFLPVSGDQCWYEAFPCAPFLDPGLRLRGETLQDGFDDDQN